MSDLAESLVGGDIKTKMKPYCTSDTTEEIFDRYAHVYLPNINTWVFGSPNIYLFVIYRLAIIFHFVLGLLYNFIIVKDNNVNNIDEIF